MNCLRKPRIRDNGRHRHGLKEPTFHAESIPPVMHARPRAENLTSMTGRRAWRDRHSECEPLTVFEPATSRRRRVDAHSRGWTLSWNEGIHRAAASDGSAEAVTRSGLMAGI